MDGNIRGLPLKTTHRLMDHNPRIGQGKTLAFSASAQQKCAHRGRLPHTQRRHVGFDELHSVVDRHAGRY